MSDNTDSQPNLPPVFLQAKDFNHHYANNVQFESTIWDITAIFGELSKRPTEESGVEVTQHASVAMSWLQAKVMATFLILNITTHEDRNGPIQIPNIVLPPGVDASEGGEFAINVINLAVARGREARQKQGS